MYICICNGITDNEIRNAIDSYYHELNVHHNDSEAAKPAAASRQQHMMPIEQAESNLKTKSQDLSELDYIKEKLDFDFCCGKCQCMVNDIIHNYNKVDIK